MNTASAPDPARILVVEDLEHARDLFKMLLEREGYVVELAADGSEAVAAVRDRPFDLILIDIQMPVMNGFDAVRAIRRIEERGRDVTIIGMSANTMPDQLRAFEEAGMDDHLRKPFRRAQLLEKIGPWLAEASAGVCARADHHAEADKVLDEVLGLLGPEWVKAGLSRLRSQIDGAFPDARTLDPHSLARHSHTIVAHAALLGFKTLSDRASALEEACLSGRGHQDALIAAEEAARAARREIERLAARLG